MRPIHKICLVIGVLWIVVFLPAYIMGFNPDNPELDQSYKPWFLGSFGPPVLLWWLSGTLKHILAWFKE